MCTKLPCNTTLLLACETAGHILQTCLSDIVFLLLQTKVYFGPQFPRLHCDSLLFKQIYLGRDISRKSKAKRERWEPKERLGREH